MAEQIKGNKIFIIFFISIIIIGIVILTNTLSFSKIESVLINELKENQLTKTEFASSQIENHLLETRDELVTLSKFPDIESLDINKCSGDMTIVHESIDGKISNILRVDKDGTVIECSSPIYSNYLGINIQNKDYFRTPKETNEPFIDSSIRQGVNRQIIITAPLFETTEYTPYPNFLGEFKGVLLSIVEVNTLYNLYIHPIANSKDAFFLLINLNSNETIIKSNNLDDYADIKESYITEKNLDVITEFSGFGETIITSSDMILGSENWRLIILTPLKNINKDLNSIQIRHILGLVFILLVLIGGFVFLIRLYKSKEEVQLKLDKAKVTLDKLGIKIETEDEKFTQADIVLKPKKIYLIKEDDENQAHELFIGSLNRGFAGLGIVRNNPHEFKKKYNLQKTSFIWLSKIKSEDQLAETRIEQIYNIILEFMKKSKKSVILVDRLDYIISENNFEEVIKKIHDLKDWVLSNECIIILSVNPELISSEKLKAIEAETIDLYGKHLKKKIELSGMELEMLKFINESNIVNKLVSYKDITQNFKITKPTTRAKISGLQNLGLLQIEQRGRFKSLKITSVGRRIIN